MKGHSGNHKTKNYSSLLPFETIVAASEGDYDAMIEVLKHYDRYITKHSYRICYDECGNTHYYKDEALCRHMQTGLILGILKFDPVPYYNK